jgi:hypothetical protein
MLIYSFVSYFYIYSYIGDIDGGQCGIRKGYTMPDANSLRYPKELTRTEWNKALGRFLAGIVSRADELGKLMDALETVSSGLGDWLLDFETKLEAVERSKDLENSPSPIFFQKIKRKHLTDFDKVSKKLQVVSKDVEKECKNSSVIPKDVTAYVKNVIAVSEKYQDTMTNRMGIAETKITANDKLRLATRKVANARIATKTKQIKEFISTCDEFSKKFDTKPALQDLLKEVVNNIYESSSSLKQRLIEFKHLESRDRAEIANWALACQRECLIPAQGMLEDVKRRDRELKAIAAKIEKARPDIEKTMKHIPSPRSADGVKGLEELQACVIKCEKAIEFYESDSNELDKISKLVTDYEKEFSLYENNLQNTVDYLNKKIDDLIDVLKYSFSDKNDARDISDLPKKWVEHKARAKSSGCDVESLSQGKKFTDTLNTMAEHLKLFKKFADLYEKSSKTSDLKEYKSNLQSFIDDLDAAVATAAKHESAIRNRLKVMMNEAPRHPVDHDFYKEDIGKFDAVESAADFLNTTIDSLKYLKKSAQNFNRLVIKA